MNIRTRFEFWKVILWFFSATQSSCEINWAKLKTWLLDNFGSSELRQFCKSVVFQKSRFIASNSNLDKHCDFWHWISTNLISRKIRVVEKSWFHILRFTVWKIKDFSDSGLNRRKGRNWGNYSWLGEFCERRRFEQGLKFEFWKSCIWNLFCQPPRFYVKSIELNWKPGL